MHELQLPDIPESQRISPEQTPELRIPEISNPAITPELQNQETTPESTPQTEASQDIQGTAPGKNPATAIPANPESQESRSASVEAEKDRIEETLENLRKRRDNAAKLAQQLEDRIKALEQKRKNAAKKKLRKQRTRAICCIGADVVKETIIAKREGRAPNLTPEGIKGRMKLDSDKEAIQAFYDDEEAKQNLPPTTITKSRTRKPKKAESESQEITTEPKSAKPETTPEPKPKKDYQTQPKLKAAPQKETKRESKKAEPRNQKFWVEEPNGRWEFRTSLNFTPQEVIQIIKSHRGRFDGNAKRWWWDNKKSAIAAVKELNK